MRRSLVHRDICASSAVSAEAAHLRSMVSPDSPSLHTFSMNFSRPSRAVSLPVRLRATTFRAIPAGPCPSATMAVAALRDTDQRIRAACAERMAMCRVRDILRLRTMVYAGRRRAFRTRRGFPPRRRDGRRFWIVRGRGCCSFDAMLLCYCSYPQRNEAEKLHVLFVHFLPPLYCVHAPQWSRADFVRQHHFPTAVERPSTRIAQLSPGARRHRCRRRDQDRVSSSSSSPPIWCAGRRRRPSHSKHRFPRLCASRASPVSTVARSLACFRRPRRVRS